MKNKGFTLIEIIAVIIIMGILLLIVFPATSRIMRGNDEKKYETYYNIVEAGLEKYGRTRRSELGGSVGIGCFDDRTLSDLIEMGYVKEFDQEDNIVCGTPSEFDSSLLAGLGVDTSLEYANLRVEGDHGKVNVEVSIICVEERSNGTYGKIVYSNLIESGESCNSDWNPIAQPDGMYNIIYDFDGGSPIENDPGLPMNYKEGVGATIYGEPTQDGYSFNGWDNGESVAFQHLISSTDTGDKEFIAKWCENCISPSNGSCTLNSSTPGVCSYDTTCNAGYTLIDGGTHNPKCIQAICSSSFVNSYKYSKNAYTFVVPCSGNYTVELWGGAGGSEPVGYGSHPGQTRGGYGGYVKGSVYLEENQVVVIKTGGKGANSGSTKKTYAGGINGGGSGYWSGGGGGRTDITIDGVLYAAAAGGGGATNLGFTGKNARVSTTSYNSNSCNSTWSGQSTTSSSSCGDAGGGGAGFQYGGKRGKNEGCGSHRGGYGGINGFISDFHLITESGSCSGNGHAKITYNP